MVQTVYVVMGNDFPDSVWTSEAAAEAYIAEKKKEQEACLGARKIYWRAYPFEVK